MAKHILHRLHLLQAFHSSLKLRQFLVVYLEFRFNDMGIVLRPQHLFAKHQDNGTRLLLRVQRFQSLGAGFHKFCKKHFSSYEFSMTVVRNAVISIPAALTILGTSEALVIPGIVFTSRK